MIVDRATAWKKAEEVVAILEHPGGKAVICGELRRGHASVKRIVIVTTASLKDTLRALEGKVDTYISGTPGHIIVTIGLQVPVYVYFTKPESWGASCLYHTGDWYFNILMRGVARKLGYRMNEHGVFLGEEIIAGVAEVQIFEVLGLEYVEPAQREKGKFYLDKKHPL